MGTTCIWVLVWIVIWGGLGAIAGKNKTCGAWGGFFLGLLGLVGFIIILCLKTDQGKYICPFCKEPIQYHATICPHCRSAITWNPNSANEK
jgi:hypothetical protein